MKTNPSTCRLTTMASEILRKLESRHSGVPRSVIIERSLLEYQHRQVELTDVELKQVAESFTVMRSQVTYWEGEGKEKPGAAQTAKRARTVNDVLGRIMARCIELGKIREAKP